MTEFEKDHSDLLAEASRWARERYKTVLKRLGVEAGTVYEVVAHREGRWWVFNIPAFDVMGQAAALSDVAAEARSIIAARDEDSPAYEDVSVSLDGVAEARRLWEESEAESEDYRE